jgi:hypothetical protein
MSELSQWTPPGHRPQLRCVSVPKRKNDCNDFHQIVTGRFIGFDPNDALFYSNFAWLLATCPERSVRDGQRAIQLATRAWAWAWPIWPTERLAESRVSLERLKQRAAVGK